MYILFSTLIWFDLKRKIKFTLLHLHMNCLSQERLLKGFDEHKLSRR